MWTDRSAASPTSESFPCCRPHSPTSSLPAPSTTSTSTTPHPQPTPTGASAAVRDGRCASEAEPLPLTPTHQPPRPALDCASLTDPLSAPVTTRRWWWWWPSRCLRAASAPALGRMWPAGGGGAGGGGGGGGGALHVDVSPSSLLSSDVWVSRALLCLLLSLTAVGAVAPVWGAETFGLIPGKTLATWPLWTFVTAAAFDTHTTTGVLHAGVLCLLCPALERGVGSRRVLLLVLVVVLCVHVSLFVCLVSLYALTESEGFLFNVWCGASSVTAAVLVALKQRWPDSPALPISASSLTLLSRLQVQHLPFLACCLSVLLGLVGWVGGKEAPLMLLGVLYSFLYLRFYQRDPDTGAVGDMRSDFAFATLFPDVLGLRGVVNLAATVPFHALMRAGAFSEAIKSAALLPPTSINGAGEAAPPSGSDATALLVGSANLRAVDPQAERRRILAIKAIDEKLAQLAQHHQHQQQQPHDSSHSVAQLSPSSAAVSSGSSSTSTSSLPAGSADAVDSIDQSSLPGEEELQRMEREVTAGMQQPQPPHLQSADAAAQRRATVEGGAHAGEVAISVRSEEAPAQRSQGFP